MEELVGDRAWCTRWAAECARVVQEVNLPGLLWRQGPRLTPCCQSPLTILFVFFLVLITLRNELVYLFAYLFFKQFRWILMSFQRVWIWGGDENGGGIVKAET